MKEPTHNDIVMPGTPRRDADAGAGAGFTRTDLLAALATGVVLAALVIVPLAGIRGRNRLQICADNLRRIGQAVLGYAGDHGTRLPGLNQTEAGDPWWWYKEEIRGYLGVPAQSPAHDRAFACPLDRGYSDPRPFCKSARFDYSSYVFNGVTLVRTPNIAGWKLPSVRQPDRTLLVMEWPAHAPLSWHRSRTGAANAPFYRDAESVVAFADGRVDLVKIYYAGQ